MNRLTARAAKFGAAAGVSIGGLVLLAAPAWACKVSIQAQGLCVGGVPTVQWSVVETPSTGGTATVTDNLGHVVVTTATSGVIQEPAGTTSVTIHVQTSYANGDKSNTPVVQVTFPSGCVVVTTTTTTTTTVAPTTTTTTVAPTTSTSAPTSTTSVPATTTTGPATAPGHSTTTTSTTTIPVVTTIPVTTTVPGATSPASATSPAAATAAVVSSPADGNLAFTGYNATETAGVGGLLIVGGVVLVAKSRRRHPGEHFKK